MWLLLLGRCEACPVSGSYQSASLVPMVVGRGFGLGGLEWGCWGWGPVARGGEAEVVEWRKGASGIDRKSRLAGKRNGGFFKALFSLMAKWREFPPTFRKPKHSTTKGNTAGGSCFCSILSSHFLSIRLYILLEKRRNCQFGWLYREGTTKYLASRKFENNFKSNPGCVLLYMSSNEYFKSTLTAALQMLFPAYKPHLNISCTRN